MVIQEKPVMWGEGEDHIRNLIRGLEFDGTHDTDWDLISASIHKIDLGAVTSGIHFARPVFFFTFGPMGIYSQVLDKRSIGSAIINSDIADKVLLAVYQIFHW